MKSVSNDHINVFCTSNHLVDCTHFSQWIINQSFITMACTRLPLVMMEADSPAVQPLYGSDLLKECLETARKQLLTTSASDGKNYL